MNPHDIIRHTQRTARPVQWLADRLGEDLSDLVPFIASMKAEGYQISLVDGYVSSRSPGIGALDVCPVVGKGEPGKRYKVALVTDIHAGSSHCAVAELKAFLKFAAKEGCEVGICTGDILDGNKDVLLHDQTKIGFDHQAEVAVEIFRTARIRWFSIDGNHDGYFSSSSGMSSGRHLQSVVRAGGIDWTFLGTCLGRATLYGARWQLWHPHGGASTRNAIRRILNERIECMEEPCDILAMGHFHKYCTVNAYPEHVFGIAGGTFQKKHSEFANRISRGWDVGGCIVSYSIDRRGRVIEPSSEFYPIK